MAKKEWKFISTNYRQKWLEFRRSNEFRDIDNLLKDKGIRQPYRANIMKSLFCNGWNSAGGKAEFIE